MSFNFNICGINFKDFFHLFRGVSDKTAASFTTDDLKFILRALIAVRTAALRDFTPRLPLSGAVNSRCVFDFTLSSFLLNKISPEVFDDLGIRRDENENVDRDICLKLYCCDLVQGRV